MRANISRTSWVFPSPTTTFHHEFMPDGVVRSGASSCGTTSWPSMTVPCASRRWSEGSGTPLTLASYSRNTPYRGCATRCASSPSLVRITRPSEP